MFSWQKVIKGIGEAHFDILPLPKKCKSLKLPLLKKKRRVTVSVTKITSSLNLIKFCIVSKYTTKWNTNYIGINYILTRKDNKKTLKVFLRKNPENTTSLNCPRSLWFQNNRELNEVLVVWHITTWFAPFEN